MGSDDHHLVGGSLHLIRFSLVVFVQLLHQWLVVLFPLALQGRQSLHCPIVAVAIIGVSISLLLFVLILLMHL